MSPDPQRIVHIDERKWPDLLHWQFDAERLGEDEHGVWLFAPASTMARRGDAPPRALGSGFVLLVPRNDSWLVEFTPTHPWHAIYINIGTKPTWDGTRVHQIDLDLDVALTHDGDVVVLDEDEFEMHKVDLGYPAELIEVATSTTETAVEALRNRRAPFDGAAERWLDQIDRRLLG